MSSLLLPLHIAGGAGGLLAGGAAMALPKGSRGHALAGSIFAASMALMGLSGAWIAAWTPDRVTATTGLFVFYLVVTSWATARGGLKVGRSMWLACAGGSAISFAYLAWGLIAAASSDGRIDRLPGTIAFVFAALAGMAAVFDVKVALVGKLSPRQRIGRHLWRMSLALLIAAMSFFVGQQKVMPEAWRGSPLLFAPEIAILLAMLGYGLRVRFAGKWRDFAARLRLTERVAA